VVAIRRLKGEGTRSWAFNLEFETTKWYQKG